MKLKNKNEHLCNDPVQRRLTDMACINMETLIITFAQAPKKQTRPAKKKTIKQKAAAHKSESTILYQN